MEPVDYERFIDKNLSDKDEKMAKFSFKELFLFMFIIFYYALLFVYIVLKNFCLPSSLASFSWISQMIFLTLLALILYIGSYVVLYLKIDLLKQ